MTDNWLQKYKDLAEKSAEGHNKPTEAHKQAQESGNEHNEDLKKQQLQHRRAAFESTTPRNLQVSGTLGRPELTEIGSDGKVVTHIKGIKPPDAMSEERKLVDLGGGVKAEEVTPAKILTLRSKHHSSSSRNYSSQPTQKFIKRIVYRWLNSHLKIVS